MSFKNQINKLSLEKINDFLFHRKTILTLLIIVTFISLNEPIVNFISKNFVANYLESVKSAWYNDLIFLLITLMSLMYVYARKKDYYPSVSILFCLILLSLIYLYYRLFGSAWIFTSTASFGLIKYADIVFLITGFNLILAKVFFKDTIKPSENQGFFYDDSIGKGDYVDSLEFEKYSKRVYDKISQSSFDSAFTLGINGKWGMGKTSFIDLIKKEFANDIANSKVIEVDFNSWNCSNPNMIVNDFFSTLNEAISKHHSSLSRMIYAYSMKLASENRGKIVSLIFSTLNVFNNKSSVDGMFNDINEGFKKIGKKVIVYIDDIDRQDDKEIFEIIRLIRNTANFANTFFIVAYDRNYVINALEKQNTYNRERFLDKIIQVEISVPFYDTYPLRRELFKKLKANLPSSEHKELEETILGTASYMPITFITWIDNLRDVTRLANSLILNIEFILGDVSIRDFTQLELLRIKFPAVHEILFRKKDLFFGTYNDTVNQPTYSLKKYEIPKGEAVSNKDSTELEMYIKRNASDLSVSKSEINQVIQYIAAIFDYDVYYSFGSKSNLSVVYTNKFDLYFKYNLSDKNLSDKEFISYLAKSQAELNNQITKWVDKGLEREVITRFEQIKVFENKEDFEKVINSIFYLANSKSKIKKHESVKIVGYQARDLYSKLSNYDDVISKLYKQHGVNRATQLGLLEKFISNIFLKAISPFLFESEFIHYLVKLGDDSFPIKQEVLNNYVIKYFSKICSTKKELDDEVWRLFHCTYNYVELDLGGQKVGRKNIPMEVKTSFKTAIKDKWLDKFIYDIILKEYRDQSGFYLSKGLLLIYDSWEEFEEVLEVNKINVKWHYVEEFIKFINLLKVVNFKTFVDFEFNDIPIHKKFNK